MLERASAFDVRVRFAICKANLKWPGELRRRGEFGGMAVQFQRGLVLVCFYNGDLHPSTWMERFEREENQDVRGFLASIRASIQWRGGDTFYGDSTPATTMEVLEYDACAAGWAQAAFTL